jgi:uncharacterized protein (TIGR02246 family)
MADEDDIRALLKVYESALNTSDTDLAFSCYSADGVFMPTTLPTAAGPELKDAYAQTFARIRLRVAFHVDELVVASDTLAYALTRSEGTQTIVATGEQGAESNREMFIFARRPDGEWKIARYMFNKPR